MAKIYGKLKKVNSKNGDIEFQAEVTPEVLEAYVLRSLAVFAEDFALPGFRKGKVPPEKVREHIGEMELMEDAANDALRDAMEEIAEDEKLDVIGRPQVVITKIAPKNPLEFRVRFALEPEVSLPDYKKIGKQIFERKDPADISEKEIDDALDRIRTMVGQVADAEKAGADAPLDEHAPLPPLTDETIKQFGNFNTVADFRAELKRELEQEKSLRLKDGKREEIIKEIVKHTKLKVPQLLVEQQLGEFIEDRDERLKTAGLSLEEYLKQMGKTAEQLDGEERTMIEDDIAMSLTVQAIRKKEAISADDREVHVLMAKLKIRYPERSESELHRTAEALILQDRLFTLLEGALAPSASASPPPIPPAAKDVKDSSGGGV